MKPVKVIKDLEYPDMYRLKWKDKVLSEDMYNLTRANDILRNYDEYLANMESRDRITKNKPWRFRKNVQDKSLQHVC